MDYERIPWAKRRSEQRKRDAALRYDLGIARHLSGAGDEAAREFTKVVELEPPDSPRRQDAERWLRRREEVVDSES